MSQTPKYDLDLTDYGVTGWNGILKDGFEELDLFLHSRILATLGETVAKYDAVYLASDGKYDKAQAAAGMIPCRGLAIEAGNDTDEIRIQRLGPMTNVGWSWTVSGAIYIDPTTAGSLTQTKPTAFAQHVGFALAATIMFVWVQAVDLIHYGTADPPTPTSYPDGVIYLKYVA